MLDGMGSSHPFAIIISVPEGNHQIVHILTDGQQMICQPGNPFRQAFEHHFLEGHIKDHV